VRVLSALLSLFLVLPFASTQVSDTLDIWVIDVEGGKAVIVKNPAGQAMMIDGGMPDMAGRGAAPGTPGRGAAPGVAGGGGVAGTPPQGAARDMPPRPPMQVEKDRDLNRVVAAAKLAGVTAFDVYLVTHYDVDHSGNVPNIAGRFPAKLFVDHGPWLDNPKLGAMNRNAGDAYLAFVADKQRMSVKPGM